METKIPGAINPSEAVTYTDASHDTWLRSRKSIGLFVINIFGASVYYNMKLQATVSTISSEAEFMAELSGAKDSKYISSILEELVFSRQEPK